MSIALKSFQFTPLREGRPLSTLVALKRKHFNSRPSARGDRTTQSIYQPFVQFQFTPLREGRLRKTHRGRPRRHRISIHAPPRGATPPSEECADSVIYFNSRPSARGDTLWVQCVLPAHISIHAPPRGATLNSIKNLDGRLISIHAPPRGATKTCNEFFRHNDFNSRPSARGDIPIDASKLTANRFQFTPLREGRPVRRSFGHALAISIHAPPRGAT